MRERGEGEGGGHLFILAQSLTVMQTDILITELTYISVKYMWES